MRKITTPIVDKMQKLALTGNVTPQIWYERITYTNKRGTYPQLLSIAILADICFWYKPKIEYDELSGQITSITKRFKEDKLQRSYQQIADRFGCTKPQAKTAVKLLVDDKLITTELRDKKEIVNIMYMEPIVENIEYLTYSIDYQVGSNSIVPPNSPIHPHEFNDTLPTNSTIPPHEFDHTYTETTTENTTQTTTEEEENIQQQQQISVNESIENDPPLNTSPIEINVPVDVVTSKTETTEFSEPIKMEPIVFAPEAPELTEKQKCAAIVEAITSGNSLHFERAKIEIRKKSRDLGNELQIYALMIFQKEKFPLTKQAIDSLRARFFSVAVKLSPNTIPQRVSQVASSTRQRYTEPI